MILPEPPEYAEFLAPYPLATQELARSLRSLLVDLLPPCVEVVWDGPYAVGMAYGFTEKTMDHFIHLPVYKNHVNIGFSNGTLLEDPAGLLVGTGSKVRHVKLTQPEDMLNPHLHDLIRQSWELAPHSGLPQKPKSVIKEMKGSKKRPS